MNPQTLPMPPLEVLLRHGLQRPPVLLDPDPEVDRNLSVMYLARQVRELSKAGALPPWDGEPTTTPAARRGNGRRWKTTLRDDRGETFPSVEAAAAHYQIDRIAIFKSLRLGRRCCFVAADGHVAKVRFERAGKVLTEHFNVGGEDATPAIYPAPRGGDFQPVTLVGDAPGPADHAPT